MTWWPTTRSSATAAGSTAPARRQRCAISASAMASVVAITPHDLDGAGCPQIIDATGKWVLPGMLDIHTHYDVEVLNGPSLSESLRHGVTTVMLGSCSLSTIHVGAADAGRHLRPRRGDPARTRHRRRRPAQDVDEPARSTSRRWRRGRSGPNLAAFIGHSDMRAPRWAWTAPRRSSNDRRRANRLRWSGGSPRR